MGTLFGSAGTTDKKKRNSSTLFGSSSGSSYDVNQVNRQIENAETRIRDAGYVKADADQRNIVEKALNLPEGQNAFFDVLEILGRPGSAVMNAIDKGVEGENIATAAWRGLSGQDLVNGSDLAEKLGVENKAGKFLLGTALDIGLDPLTYVPGGVLAKGVQKGAAVAAKPVKAAYKAVESASPALKTLRTDTIQPLFGDIKDAIGYGLGRDYKLDETLFGTKNDAILKAKQQTENNIDFMTEESMRNIADTAKLAGGIDTGTDVGRIMERDLQSPNYRPMSDDPKIQEAAARLMDSNDEIREWANSNGINVNEIAGYMKHVLDREQRKRMRNTKPVDAGNFGTGQPNKSILKQRKYKGSAEDINEQMVNDGKLNEGEKFFEENAFFSTAIGQKQLIQYGNSVNFRRQVLSNPDFARKLEDGERVGQLPKNQVVIDTNNYKFLDDEAAEGMELADEIGGQYVVTKAVKNALDRYQKLTTDEGINGFLKAYDKLQSAWKRATLFSIPYHVRNDIGAKFNNWVGGMNTPSLIKYSAIADKEIGEAVFKGLESEAYKEFRKQGLGNSSLAQIEFARRGEEPEEAIRRTIENRSKTTGQKVTQRLNPLNAFQTSQEIGSFIDTTNRFSLFKWALDKGMTPEQAAKKVREVQFDYSNMTALEKEVFSRVVPFYRWMRNNLPFQIKQFIQDPRKYANINKVRENAQDAVGIDDENVPDWMKSSFALPVSGEDGSGQFLGLNLPLGDLTKLSDPLKLLLDSVTPLAKLPAEVALNRNFFYDKPIEKFEGQEKQFRIPGTNVDFGINATTAYILEQLTGQMGRGLSGYLQKPEDMDQDTAFRMPKMGISSMLKPFDAEKSEYFQQREQLQKLLDLIQYIEQQTGQDVRTINEIEKAVR